MKRTMLLALLAVATMASAQTEVQNQEAETKTIRQAGTNLQAGVQKDSLTMDSLLLALPEVEVMGSRPIMRAEQGKLVFDLPHLIEGKGVSTAYDALKELPGVTEQNGGLLLTGRHVTVIIDGKPSTMTAEQVAQLLKSMPASRIRDAEVMVAAPASYQVRGQVINLNLLHDEAQQVVQGQVRLGVERQHDAKFTEAASFFGQWQKWSVDAMFTHRHGRDFYEGETRSLHSQLSGKVYDIRSHTLAPSRSHDYDYRFEVDYGSLLSLAYTGNFQSLHTNGTTDGSITSEAKGHSRHTLHNLRADYRSPFGLKAGADFTHYEAPSVGTVTSVLPTGPKDYETESLQRINRLKLYASMEHKLNRNWGVNYGAAFTTTSDRSHQNISIEGMNSAALLHETIANLYAGFSKAWGKHLSLDASLSVERFHNDTFREWVLFPTLTAVYTPRQGHVVQLSIAGNRNYPEYWAVTSAKGFTDGGYGEVAGNPGLRPAKDYQLQAVYLLRNKYQLALWFNHTDDYFVQTCYQWQDRLAMEYRHVNFDFRQQAGFMAYAPVSVGRWLRSSVSAYLLWERAKDSDYYDLPFDRHIVSTMFNLRNTIIFSPVFSMNVNGFARTKSHQGLYDLPASGNLTVELQAQLLDKRLLLKAFVGNILKTNAIEPRLDYQTQHYTMGYTDYSTFGLAATLSLGGYKARQREAVDTSRFKK